MSTTTLDLKAIPDDIYERIKNYVVSKGEEWDDDVCFPKKHFFFLNFNNNKNLLVFDHWEYNCPMPNYQDLNVMKDDNKVKIVSRSKV